MSETPHTPEPWIARRSTGVIGGEVEHWAIDGPPQGLAGRWWIASAKSDEPRDEANAQRIVACVNACAGMADPQATISALVEALTALADYSAGYDEYADSGLAERITAARAALALVQP